MLPAATVRALTTSAFTAAEFTPTQWESAEDKAKFANALVKFIAHVAARSHAHWLAAVFARPGRTLCLRRDPGRTGRQSPCYRS